MMISLQTVYNLLLKHYGPQGWWPLATQANQPGFDERGYHQGDYTHPKTPQQQFEVCLGAILAQNTSWKNVEKVMHNLQKHHLLARKVILEIPEKRLAQLIRSAGYFNQKAKKLKAFAQFKGPITRENLLAIWGIGKETADSVLCYAYHQPIFVVDAYTQRIFHRLGFSEQGYDAIQQRVMHKWTDEKTLHEFHALLVELGKNICTPTPRCDQCPLKKVCQKRGIQKEAIRSS